MIGNRVLNDKNVVVLYMGIFECEGVVIRSTRSVNGRMGHMVELNSPVNAFGSEYKTIFTDAEYIVKVA